MGRGSPCYVLPIPKRRSVPHDVCRRGLSIGSILGAGGCRGDFPLQGVTPDGDYEFTVMFDSEDVEYIDSGKVLGERNREQKTELAQARKTAKANKDWAAIRSHLEDDRQEFKTADLNSWGYSKNVITRHRKGLIKEIGVKRYEL